MSPERSGAAAVRAAIRSTALRPNATTMSRHDREHREAQRRRGKTAEPLDQNVPKSAGNHAPRPKPAAAGTNFRHIALDAGAWGAVERPAH